MPDYRTRFQKMQQEHEQTAMQDAPVDNSKLPVEEQINQEYNQQITPPEVDPRKKQYNTSATQRIGQGVTDEEMASRNSIIEGEGGNERVLDRQDLKFDPNTFSPDSVYAGFMEKSGQSFMYGIGNMIGSWGDVFQVVGSMVPGVDMKDGNLISKGLQSMGADIQEKYKHYIPEEMLSPEWSFSTLVNPDFWSEHVASAIPQILEILATDGLTKIAEKGVTSSIKYGLKETLEAGAEAAAKKGLKGTTLNAWKGGEAINEVAGTGRGLLGKMITDRGTLTKTGSMVTRGVAGGTLMNLRTSLGDAAEVYNTYKGITNEDGSRMFSDAELGNMAAGAFTNNMQYMGLDMVSWGMSFGGGWNKLSRLSAKGTATMSEAVQRKVVGGMVAKTLSPVMSKMGKWATGAVVEGLEETVQESFEEYAKFRAYKDIAGTWKGYQGVTKDYDNFFDYYTSKDSEALRMISFGAGAAIGGLFNFKELVNKTADDAYKTYNRAENLKSIFQKGTDSAAWQDYHIRSQMSELVFDGKEAYFADFVDGLAQENIIDQGQYDYYANLFDEMMGAKADISKLNIKGKKALMMNVTQQSHIQNRIEQETADSVQTVEILKQQLSEDPEALAAEIKNEEKRLANQLVILTKISDNLRKDKINIMTGKKANGVKWDTTLDDNGKETIIMTDDDTAEPADPDAKKPIPEMNQRNLGDMAKALFQKVWPFGKDENNAEIKNDINPEADAQEELSAEQEIDNLAKDNYVFSHVTNDEGIENINANGFNVSPGTGTASTLTHGHENLKNQMSKLNNGEVVHRDLNNSSISVVTAPKALLDQYTGKDAHEKLENYLAENGLINEKGNYDIPKEFLAGTFKEGKFNKSGSTPSLSTEAKSSTTEASAVSTEVGTPVLNNPDIYEDDATTDINDKVMQNFTNNGDIPSGVINQITEDIAAGKTLNENQLAVQKTFGKEIEQNLQAKKAIEAEVLSADDDILTDKEKDYVRKATLRPERTTINAENINFEEVLANKKGNAGTETDEDVFGDTGRARRIGNFSEAMDYAKNALSKRKGFFSSLKKDYKQFKSNVHNVVAFDDQSDMDSIRFGQQTAVNQKLSQMFPDANINVTSVKNLTDVIGYPVMGYTLAGAIYIDENRWNQDNVLMHEMSHIFYDLMQNEPETNVFMKYALADQKLVDQVMEEYADYIKFSSGKGDPFTKRQMQNSNTFRNLSSADFQQIWEKAINDGKITQLPIEQQDVIKEEVFAIRLEGPLSEKYNRYFEAKDEPARQYQAKSWWKKIKKYANDASLKGNISEQSFLKSLTPEQNIEYTNARDFIFEQFKNGIAGNDISATGKAKMTEADERIKSDEILAIRKDLENERNLYLGVDRYKRDREFAELAGIEVLDNVFQDMLDGDHSESFFETDRLQYGEKATQIIRDFAKNYNRVLRKRFYIKNKNKPTNWRTMPVFDKDTLTVRLMEMARGTTTNEEFIRRINNSDVEEIFEFNEFLKENRPDRNMLLSSMKFIYGNQQHINSIVNYVASDGRFQVQNNLNNRELSITDNILDKVVKSAKAYFGKTPDQREQSQSFYLKEFNGLINAVENVRSNNYTQKDVFDVLRFFTNQNINAHLIMRDNTINIDGKNFTVESVVKSLVKNVFTKKDPNNKDKSDYSVYDNVNKTGIKPIIRKMIQSVVATNRKFTADFTVTNAVGNQTPVRIIDNALTREIRNMEQDALRMGKVNFLKKYSNVSGDTSQGSQGNQLLNYFHDQVMAGNRIELNQFDGTKNDMTKNNSVIKESNDTEQSVNEFLMYLDSGNNNSYLMETGRYSDSPVSYVMKVPKVKIADIGKFNGQSFAFNSKSTSAIKNAHNIYQQLKGAMDLKEFGEHVSRQIENEIRFINDNHDALGNIENTKSLFDANVLNEAGKNKVAEYVANQMLNGLYYSEIFFPSYDTKDYTKRSKSGRSPGFAFGKHVQIEGIPFIDAENDSGVLILEQDAKRVQQAGGNLMPLGKSYKLLNTGVEHDNPNFAKKNIYDKGYFTVLNDAVVKQNPAYSGIFELMKRRRQKYEDTHGKITDDLLNGIPTQFLYAYPTSSNKSGNFPSKLVNQDESLTDTGKAFDINTLNDGNFDDAVGTLDKWYYDGDSFMGLSGDNFVVQQVMDKEIHESNTPVQMMRAILTNSAVNGNRQLAESIQQDIVNQQKATMEQYREIIENGSREDLRNLLVSKMLLEDVDPTQRFLLLQDKLSISTPALRELAKNTLSNFIRLNGNKLSTPGTNARAKAAKYQKQEGFTNGSQGLAFYNKNSDGSLTKGEAVVPGYMEGDVRKRQYLMFGKVDGGNTDMSAKTEIFERRAAETAKQHKVGYGRVYDADNNLTGFYVEGDTIIATRIPSHGPQTTGVFEVVDFDASGAGDVQLPTEFALSVTGGDYDGDQFFIQHKGKGNKFGHWNSAFDKLTGLWLSKEMASEVVLPIDFENEARTAIGDVAKIYGEKDFDTMIFSPEGRRQAFRNTLISKGNIGITANLHSLLGMLSAYETELKMPISIDGVRANVFRDSATESRTINSAKIFNIILDNSKHHFADKLGINQHTASAAMILRNLGYDLSTIGIVLNSPVVQRLNELMSKNDNIYTDKLTAAELDATVRRLEKLPEGKKVKEIKINIDNITTAENQAAILDLMANLNTVNSEIMKFSAIMQGHTTLENNPFILRNQLDNFNDLADNKDNKGIVFPADLRNNPMVQNYLDVFKFNMGMQQQMDPVYREDMVSVFDKIYNGLGRNLNNQNVKLIHNDIETFTTARMLGMNNIPADYMMDLLGDTEKSIFKKMTMQVMALKNDIVKVDKNNPALSVSAFDNSLLFSKALSMSTVGNQQYISLNPNYFNNTMTEPERERVLAEFASLPLQVKNDLMLYDLFTTGFKGPRSLFHLFSHEMKQRISNAAASDVENKSTNTNYFHQNELAERVVGQNPELLVQSKVYPFTKNAGGWNISVDFIKAHPGLMRNIEAGKDTFFAFRGSKNQQLIAHFSGWTNEDIAEIKQMNPNDVRAEATRMAIKRMKTFDARPYKNKIGVVAIPDTNTGTPLTYGANSTDTDIDWNDIAIGLEEDNDLGGMARREMASDYYNYTSQMTREDYVNAMGMQQASEVRKSVLWNDYLTEKKKADEAFKTVNYNTVTDMSTEKLLELYGSKGEVMGHPMGFGHRDKFAYANVLRPIIMEIAKRNGMEQSQLTGKEYDHKDLGFFQSWLMSNNIPSDQPEIQALVRKMEVEYKKFLAERSVYVGRINEATDALYKEKFGFAVNNASFKDTIKSMFSTMFKNRDTLYRELYGPLIDFQNVQDDNGNTITNMKYKSAEQVEADHAAGIISPAQYNFYKTTREITDYLKPFALQNGKSERADYIPHTAPAWMEIKARRGMLGLAVNSRTLDERIYDVKMSFNNPMTGQFQDNVNFKFIEDVYNTLSKTNNRTASQAIEFTKLKNKAVRLARNGKNENGTPLVISNIEAGSAIGDVFMDRFSKSRSVSATDLPSLDLNKAFVDYTHGVLFNHGNENFAGMNNMLPLVDGILSMAQERGDVNAQKYVEKIWKEYFLSGKKQDTLPNSSVLESFGISTDKVVNYLTKASLIYWLGWQGLALGLGYYAIGNVLVGKYTNIKTQGLGQWAKGEKRFWRGRGGFDITNPFKGVQDSVKILHTAGFMDINVYDDVNIEQKTSIDKHFTNLSLLPMIWSEKWIQGVDFLGRLSDEEYDQLVAGGKLDPARMTELENEVKNNHGKGYQPTDQRMIQMYSWGSAMLQFSRYLPTMFYDQFAKEDMNIYGKKHIGTYTSVGKMIQKGVTGKWSPKEFMAYRRGLDAYEKRRLDQGLVGFGMLTSLFALNAAGSKYGDKGLIADANPLLDFDKLWSKTTPPFVNMLGNIAN